MITRPRIKTILDLALPLTVGLSSTFIMAMIDLAMVGRLGTAAVAAVGLGGFTYTLVAAILHGVRPAVQAIVARRVGEGSAEPKCLPLNAGLLLALLSGIPLSLLVYWMVPRYYSYISSDPAVVKEGIAYLLTMTIGLTATGMANAFQGHFAGSGKTRIYMLNLLFANCLNVFLNYVLIYGNLGAPAFGVAGSGYATSISIWTSVLIYFVVTKVLYRGEGFLAIKPKADLVVRTIQIGVPSTMEAGFFSLGFLVFYWIVGHIGTPELAATNVLARISILMDLFAQALGMAAITLVSRTLGSGDSEGAAAWGWDVAKIAVFVITLFSLPLVVAPRACLSVFLSDRATVELAVLPAQLTGATLGLASLIYIFASALIALGDGKRVILVSFATQWILFLPAVWVVGVMLQGGLLGITYVQLVYGLIATSLIVAIWTQGRWKKIAI